MNRFLIILALVLLCILPVSAQTPTYVQGASGSLSNTQNGAVVLTVYKIPLPNKVSSGNAVVVAFQFGFVTGRTVTCTDDQSNVYTKTVTETNDGNQTVVGFTSLNITNSPQVISLTISGAGSQFGSGVAAEFANVATTSAVDGHNSNSGTSGTVTAGAFTPTTSGDLIFLYAVNDGVVPMTSWAVGTNSNITWNLLTTDILDGQAMAYGVYNSTAAITPQIIQSPSNSFLSLAIALKAAAAGTIPTGMRVQTAQHNNTTNETGATIKLQFPRTGNSAVLGFIASNDGGTYYTISSISDGTNTWTEANTPNTKPENGSVGQFWHADNLGAASSLVTTLTMTGSAPSGFGATAMLYDVVGAATSPYDTNGVATGNAATTTITGAGLTPSTSGGLVFSEIGVASATVLSNSAPVGALFESTTIVTAVNPQHCDENNGWIIYANSSTSPLSTTWATDVSAGNWAAMTASFKAPSGGGSSTIPQVMVIHP